MNANQKMSAPTPTLTLDTVSFNVPTTRRDAVSRKSCQKVVLPLKTLISTTWMTTTLLRRKNKKPVSAYHDPIVPKVRDGKETTTLVLEDLSNVVKGQVREDKLIFGEKWRNQKMICPPVDVWPLTSFSLVGGAAFSVSVEILRQF